MLRCAIVGLGRWGQQLVDSCMEQGKPIGETLLFTHAVVRSRGKYDEFCKRQSLTAVTDYQRLVEGSDIDAVVLATPHSQHFEQIMLATANNKHVFVEKPFTMGAENASHAAESARNAGIIVAVGHNRRFLPALQDLKAMIDTGKLGTITHMEGNFSGPFALGYDSTMWRANSQESPAGGMTAMGIHIVDAFIYLGGPIVGVYAQSQKSVLDVEIDDTTSVLMQFENGVSAYLSTLCATARQWRLQVFGTSGWAQLRDHHILDFCPVGQQEAKTIPYAQVDIERAELEAFAGACRGDEPYPITLEEAVHGIAVQDSIIASAAASSPLYPVEQQGNFHPPSRSDRPFARD